MKHYLSTIAACSERSVSSEDCKLLICKLCVRPSWPDRWFHGVIVLLNPNTEHGVKRLVYMANVIQLNHTVLLWGCSTSTSQHTIAGRFSKIGTWWWIWEVCDKWGLRLPPNWNQQAWIWIITGLLCWPTTAPIHNDLEFVTMWHCLCLDSITLVLYFSNGCQVAQQKRIHIMSHP